MIIDDVKTEDVLKWMDDERYEKARDEMNKGTIEDLIVEFVEMMWSIELDYLELKEILRLDYHTTMDKENIIVEGEIDQDNIHKLRKIKLILDKKTKYIQNLVLFVSEQPSLKTLMGKLQSLSKELNLIEKDDRICIKFDNGKSIIIELRQ